MVVIVIIGLLAGAVTINVRGYMIRAKQNIARQDIQVICTAVRSFWADTGKYPRDLSELTVKSAKTGEPYLTKAPLDPWGNSYQYLCPGRKNAFEVICLGADNNQGGDGADADISSDDLQEQQTGK